MKKVINKFFESLYCAPNWVTYLGIAIGSIAFWYALWRVSVELFVK